MRSNISTLCNLPHQPQALAQVYYDGADTASQPSSQPWPYTDNGQCSNDDLALTTPTYAISPDPHPARTFTITLDNIVNGTGHREWRLNHQRFQGDFNNALLLQTHQRNHTYLPEWNVVEAGEAKTIRLIVNNNSTVAHVSTSYPPSPSPLPSSLPRPFPPLSRKILLQARNKKKKKKKKRKKALILTRAHQIQPMHIHGHQLSVLHEGPGFYTNQPLTNPSNPQRRDTQMLRPGGHIVVQYEADNPGVWPFHCHIAWHLSLVSPISSFPPSVILQQEGMYVRLKEGRGGEQWADVKVGGNRAFIWISWNDRMILLPCRSRMRWRRRAGIGMSIRRRRWWIRSIRGWLWRYDRWQLGVRGSVCWEGFRDNDWINEVHATELLYNNNNTTVASYWKYWGTWYLVWW